MMPAKRGFTFPFHKRRAGLTGELCMSGWISWALAKPISDARTANFSRRFICQPPSLVVMARSAFHSAFDQVIAGLRRGYANLELSYWTHDNFLERQPGDLDQVAYLSHLARVASWKAICNLGMFRSCEKAPDCYRDVR
jgi:hypothetical protein